MSRSLLWILKIQQSGTGPHSTHPVWMAKLHRTEHRQSVRVHFCVHTCWKQGALKCAFFVFQRYKPLLHNKYQQSILTTVFLIENKGFHLTDVILSDYFSHVHSPAFQFRFLLCPQVKLAAPSTLADTVSISCSWELVTWKQILRCSCRKWL